MLIETVKTKIPRRKEEQQVNKSSKKINREKTTNSKISTIIVSIIITFILGYVAADIIFFKTKSENNAIIVNQKLDSLRIHLDNEMPKIDNAIIIQEEQLKNLKDISSINK